MYASVMGKPMMSCALGGQERPQEASGGREGSRIDQESVKEAVGGLDQARYYQR